MDARGEPTATPKPGATATPSPKPNPTPKSGGSNPVITLPKTGAGDPASDGLTGWAAVAALGLGLAAAGLVARRQRA